MHEPTFRRALRRGRPEPLPAADGQHPRAVLVGDRGRRGRHREGQGAGRAARSRRRAASSRCSEREVPVTQAVLVVGGGIAGIQAALAVRRRRQQGLPGRAGAVDRRPHGHARQDLPDPRLLGLHPDAQDGRRSASTPTSSCMTYSEVEEVGGYVGNFKVKIRRKATYVDDDKCNGCGLCQEKCPVQGRQRVRAEHGPAQGHLHALPAGGAQQAGHRPRACNYFGRRQGRRRQEEARAAPARSSAR